MKVYRVLSSDLAEFKQQYAAMTRRNTRGNEFWVKGWVLAAVREGGGAVSILVSEETPAPEVLREAVLSPRKKSADEKEASSRKDTLWGDLKLMAKKACREGRHRYDYANEAAKANLHVRFPKGAPREVGAGDPYFFRIVPGGLFHKPQFWNGEMEVFSDKTQGDEPNDSRPFSEYYHQLASRQWKLVLALGSFILAVYAYNCTGMRHSVSPSDHLAARQQLARLESTHQEKRFNSAIEKFKREVESRQDMGILMSEAVPVPNENEMLLVTVREDWKEVQYQSRLAGLKALCPLWVRIIGRSPDQDVAVRLQAGPERGNVIVGECRSKGGEWVEK